MFYLLCIAVIVLGFAAWALLRQDRIYDEWEAEQRELWGSYERQRRADEAEAARRDLEDLLQ